MAAWSPAPANCRLKLERALHDSASAMMREKASFRLRMPASEASLGLAVAGIAICEAEVQDAARLASVCSCASTDRTAVKCASNRARSLALTRGCSARIWDRTASRTLARARSRPLSGGPMPDMGAAPKISRNRSAGSLLERAGLALAAPAGWPGTATQDRFGSTVVAFALGRALTAATMAGAAPILPATTCSTVPLTIRAGTPDASKKSLPLSRGHWAQTWGCWARSPPGICIPVTTVTRSLSLRRSSGASCQSSGTVQFAPVVAGAQVSFCTPLPQNQTPNRRGSGAPWAKAVPEVFSIASRVGSPISATPPAAAPRRTVRRCSALKRFLLII